VENATVVCTVVIAVVAVLTFVWDKLFRRSNQFYELRHKAYDTLEKWVDTLAKKPDENTPTGFNRFLVFGNNLFDSGKDKELEKYNREIKNHIDALDDAVKHHHEVLPEYSDIRNQHIVSKIWKIFREKSQHIAERAKTLQRDIDMARSCFSLNKKTVAKIMSVVDLYIKFAREMLGDEVPNEDKKEAIYAEIEKICKFGTIADLVKELLTAMKKKL